MLIRAWSSWTAYECSPKTVQFFYTLKIISKDSIINFFDVLEIQPRFLVMLSNCSFQSYIPVGQVNRATGQKRKSCVSPKPRKLQIEYSRHRPAPSQTRLLWNTEAHLTERTMTISHTWPASPCYDSTTSISSWATGKHLPLDPMLLLTVYNVPVHMEQSAQVISSESGCFTEL